MPFRIAVASGKGGTGKTSVSLLLYQTIRKYFSQSVQLIDCDVEEPNDLIFFPEATSIAEEQVNQLIPRINRNTCTFCRKCQEYCEFNAIVIIPPAGFAEVTPELCHSCGACIHACEYGAIEEIPKEIGWINTYSLDKNGKPDIIEGRLRIGSAMQTALIRELKKRYNKHAEFIICDAPPGTSCPVVSSVSDADFVILVTEPTPFGLHDLKLTVELMNEMDKKFAVFINKHGLGNSDTEEYLKKRNIEILARFPFEKSFAVDYARGLLMENIPHKTEQVFKELIENIIVKFNQYAGDYSIERKRRNR